MEIMQKILPKQHRDLLQWERRLANDLLTCLVGHAGEDSQTVKLQKIITALADFFQLVIIGEFNAGKSSLINALLRQTVLTEGDTPTTRSITIIRFRDQDQKNQYHHDNLELYYPIDFLQDMSIVDTPGINAVKDENERAIEDFIPSSGVCQVFCVSNL